MRGEKCCLVWMHLTLCMICEEWQIQRNFGTTDTLFTDSLDGLLCGQLAVILSRREQSGSVSAICNVEHDELNEWVNNDHGRVS